MRLFLSLGPAQGKRRILRRLSRPVLRTEARAPAIKTPFAEKREIQWKRNGHEWMTERRGRAARESGKGEKKSKGENDRKRARERERDCLASALLQLAAVVYQRCPRCNLIRALSHERTESALQAGPLVLSPPPLFRPPPSTSPPRFLFLFLPIRLPTVVVRLVQSFYELPDCGPQPVRNKNSKLDNFARFETAY